MFLVNIIYGWSGANSKINKGLYVILFQTVIYMNRGYGPPNHLKYGW